MHTLRTLKILVVDDEPVNLRVMKMMLASDDFEVLETSTGEACLEMARREQPDIVLLDVVLPGLSGPQVSEQIKADAALAGTYIILVSEKKVSSDDRVEGLVGGADSYLARPFSKRELLAHISTGARIRALIRSLSEEVAQRQHSEAALRQTLVEMERLQQIEREHVLSSQRLAVVQNLHDGIGGIATNIKLLADVGLATLAPEGVHGTLTAISDLAAEGISEVRTFMDVLEESTVTWRDLFVEMRRYGATMLEPHGTVLENRLSGDGAERDVSLLVYMALLRVFKEAVVNAIKHADARIVRLTVTVSDAALCLSVEDDGRGLAHEVSQGRGLASMCTRVRDIGGSLSVGTGIGGRGTGVTVSLSLAPGSVEVTG